MATTIWSGELTRIPFPEVLRELHRERVSGLLVCTRGGSATEVLMERGIPRWCTSSDPADSFAGFLLRRGWINLDPETGEPAMDEVDAAADTLGREQALELLLDLFTWSNGAFLFAPAAESDDTGRTLGYSFETLLTQGLRRVNRLPTLRAAVGSLDDRLAATGEIPTSALRALGDDNCLVLGEIRRPGSADRTADTWPCDHRLLQCIWELKLLGLIFPAAGNEGVAVRSLLRRSPAAATAPLVTAAPAAELEEDVLSQTVVLEAMLAASQPPTRPVPAPSPIEAAKPAAAARPPAAATRAPVAPANAAPARPAAATPPTAAPVPAPVAAASPAAVATVAPAPTATAAAEAPRVPPPARPVPPAATTGGPAELRNLATCEISAVVTELGAAEMGVRDDGKGKQVETADAVTWFKNGERFLKEIDLHNAVTSFREAVRLAPDNADYQLKLGTTLAHNPKWRKEAEEHLIRASEIQPWQARYHIALARLYAEAGLHRRAEQRYRQAQEAEPGDTVAAKELAAMQARVKAAKSGKPAPAEGDKPPTAQSLLQRLARRSKGEAAEAARPRAADPEEIKVG